MSGPRIVVTGKIPDAGLALLREAGELWAWDGDDPIPTDVRDEQLATADAVVTLLTDRVDDAFLDAAPNARIVANVAVGYNNIDVAACTARGVTVTNTPGVLAEPAPTVLVDEFADSTINLRCWIWVEPLERWTVKDEAMRDTKRALDASGITIAFPQRVLHTATARPNDVPDA